jgi:biotin carboxyl carrier protein
MQKIDENIKKREREMELRKQREQEKAAKEKLDKEEK